VTAITTVLFTTELSVTAVLLQLNGSDFTRWSLC